MSAQVQAILSEISKARDFVKDGGGLKGIRMVVGHDLIFEVNGMVLRP